jgi:hypothetical protein
MLEYKDIIYIVLGMVGIIVALFAIFSGEYVRMVADQKVDIEVRKAKAELKAILEFADAIKIYQKDISAAIKLSESALPNLTGIELLQAKSNLAYYYAMGSYTESKSRALSLAQETLVQAFRFPDRINNWKINYGYVIMRYGISLDEIERSIVFLESVARRQSLNDEELEEIEGYLREAREKKAQALHL